MTADLLTAFEDSVKAHEEALKTVYYANKKIQEYNDAIAELNNKITELKTEIETHKNSISDYEFEKECAQDNIQRVVSNIKAVEAKLKTVTLRDSFCERCDVNDTMKAVVVKAIPGLTISDKKEIQLTEAKPVKPVAVKSAFGDCVVTEEELGAKVEGNKDRCLIKNGSTYYRTNKPERPGESGRWRPIPAYRLVNPYAEGYRLAWVVIEGTGRLFASAKPKEVLLFICEYIHEVTGVPMSEFYPVAERNNSYSNKFATIRGILLGVGHDLDDLLKKMVIRVYKSNHNTKNGNNAG